MAMDLSAYKRIQIDPWKDAKLSGYHIYSHT
jgi:hypothetical protein